MAYFRLSSYLSFAVFEWLRSSETIRFKCVNYKISTNFFQGKSVFVYFLVVKTVYFFSLLYLRFILSTVFIDRVEHLFGSSFVQLACFEEREKKNLLLWSHVFNRRIGRTENEKEKWRLEESERSKKIKQKRREEKKTSRTIVTIDKMGRTNGLMKGSIEKPKHIKINVIWNGFDLV